MMPKRIPETISEAINQYIRSEDLNGRTYGVQKEYWRVGWHLEAEIGETEISQINRQRLSEWRHEWAKSGHRAATLKLHVLRRVLQVTLPSGTLPQDLFDGLSLVHREYAEPLRQPNIPELRALSRSIRARLKR